MDNKNEFKPFIPADKIVPEFTVTSVVLGLILAVVFGAANAYLGLRVGMTVSASIPAAVISMGVIRVIMKKIPSWRTIWCRPSVLPESLWQPEQFSPFRPSSCGQRKERPMNRDFSPSLLSLYAVVSSVCFL